MKAGSLKSTPMSIAALFTTAKGRGNPSVHWWMTALARHIHIMKYY